MEDQVHRFIYAQIKVRGFSLAYKIVSLFMHERRTMINIKLSMKFLDIYTFERTHTYFQFQI